MDNKKILDIGSLFSDLNQGAASKFGQFFQDKIAIPDKKETSSTQTTEYEDRENVGDYDVSYQAIRYTLDNMKQKWGTDDIESNLFNPYYQRDLLYLYDRITLDMNYLGADPDRNNEWLEKLLELKYEIRNLL